MNQVQQCQLKNKTILEDTVKAAVAGKPTNTKVDKEEEAVIRQAAEMLNPLSQKSHSKHSSPPTTSRMTIQNLLRIIQQNVQQILSHKLLTTLL